MVEEKIEKIEKIKVALLEDDELLARVIKDYLEMNGFQVFHSPEGTGAWLEELKKEGVKNFLLDVEQKNQPLGIIFAEKIKKNEEIKNPKIILMSGSPEHEEKAKQMGHPFVSKPFFPESLIELLNQHFKKK